MTSILSGKSRYLLISLAVLALDQWTKWLVESHLPEYTVHKVGPFLNLTHVINTGVAFGLFAGPGHELAGRWVLICLSLAALTFVGFYFSRVPSSDRMLLVALSLVLGGAVGNLVDRVMSGGVTDFIDVYFRNYHWHTFNVADSAITVGIVFMLISAYREPTAEGSAESSAESPSPTEPT